MEKLMWNRDLEACSRKCIKHILRGSGTVSKTLPSGAFIDTLTFESFEIWPKFDGPFHVVSLFCLGFDFLWNLHFYAVDFQISDAKGSLKALTFLNGSITTTMIILKLVNVMDCLLQQVQYIRVFDSNNDWLSPCLCVSTGGSSGGEGCSCDTWWRAEDRLA